MNIWKDTRYVINFAFECGGKNYYQFQDAANKPYERALQAITFYTELEENCSKEVMKEFHTEIGKCFKGTAIDISRLVQIHKILGDRIYHLPPAPSLIKRLASVIYFDETENPTTYDYAYNLEKIKHWEKYMPNGDFFLFQPVKVLIPFLNESDVNLQTYLKVWQEIEGASLSSLLSPQSQKENSKEQSRAEV